MWGSTETFGDLQERLYRFDIMHVEGDNLPMSLYRDPAHVVQLEHHIHLHQLTLKGVGYIRILRIRRCNRRCAIRNRRNRVEQVLRRH